MPEDAAQLAAIQQLWQVPITRACESPKHDCLHHVATVRPCLGDSKRNSTCIHAVTARLQSIDYLALVDPVEVESFRVHLHGDRSSLCGVLCGHRGVTHFWFVNIGSSNTSSSCGSYSPLTIWWIALLWPCSPWPPEALKSASFGSFWTSGASFFKVYGSSCPSTSVKVTDRLVPQSVFGEYSKICSMYKQDTPW